MTVQIAVKLPDDLLERIDTLVSEGVFASRSAAVRHGLETVVEKRKRELIDEAFREGFRRFPETEEELQEATRLAIESIEEEPWEKWW